MLSAARVEADRRVLVVKAGLDATRKAFRANIAMERQAQKPRGVEWRWREPRRPAGRAGVLRESLKINSSEVIGDQRR